MLDTRIIIFNKLKVFLCYLTTANQIPNLGVTGSNPVGHTIFDCGYREIDYYQKVLHCSKTVVVKIKIVFGSLLIYFHRTHKLKCIT